jgi:hypothetical protein
VSCRVSAANAHHSDRCVPIDQSRARGAALDSARAEKHDGIASIGSRCALAIARRGVERKGARD